MAKKIMAVPAGMKNLSVPRTAPKPAKKIPRKKSIIIQKIGLSTQEKLRRTKRLREVQRLQNKFDNPEAIDCLLTVEETAEKTCNLLKNMLRSYGRRNISNKDIKYFTKYKIKPLRYASDLLLQRKYTDNEILNELKKYYPNEDNKILNRSIKNARTQLNCGRLHTPRANGLISAHINIIKDIGTDKRIVQPYSPYYTKKPRKTIFDLQII